MHWPLMQVVPVRQRTAAQLALPLDGQGANSQLGPTRPTIVPSGHGANSLVQAFCPSAEARVLGIHCPFTHVVVAMQRMLAQASRPIGMQAPFTHLVFGRHKIVAQALTPAERDLPLPNFPPTLPALIALHRGHPGHPLAPVVFSWRAKGQFGVMQASNGQTAALISVTAPLRRPALRETAEALIEKEPAENTGGTVDTPLQIGHKVHPCSVLGVSCWLTGQFGARHFTTGQFGKFALKSKLPAKETAGVEVAVSTDVIARQRGH